MQITRLCIITMETERNFWAVTVIEPLVINTLKLDKKEKIEKMSEIIVKLMTKYLIYWHTRGTPLPNNGIIPNINFPR